MSDEIKAMDKPKEERFPERPLMLALGDESAILGTSQVWVTCKDGSGYWQEVVVYDIVKLAQIHARDGESQCIEEQHEECQHFGDALEFFEYNYLRYPAGPAGPLFVYPRTGEEIHEAYSQEESGWQG